MNTALIICALAVHGAVHAGESEQPPKPKSGNREAVMVALPEDLALRGKTLHDALILLGNPDRIARGELFSARFENATYEIVLVYTRRKLRVFVTEDAKVLGVLRPKE